MADIAIVTGASSGIGLRTVAALAADGWHVVATARNPGGSPELAAVAADHDRVETAVLDVTDEASVDGAVATVLAHHGRVDLLVNNAGVGHRGTTEQLSVEEFAATMDVNFYGVVRATKAVLPAMRRAGSGRIITVTSMNGVIGMPFSDAYNASKFAVEGLMEGLSPVASAFGVHVSVLEPGPVQTPFFASIRGHTDEGAADDPYTTLLDTYNDGIRGLAQDGEDPADVAAVIAAIAREERPHLRYQSSARASDLSGLKLVDTTGDSIVGVTRGLLGID